MALVVLAGVQVGWRICSLGGLRSLSVSGTTGINTSTVTTSGTQTYGGTATLGADATLTGTTVTFNDPIVGGTHTVRDAMALVMLPPTLVTMTE